MKRKPASYYTPQEVAERLSVTRRTVYAWIKAGMMNATKAGPKLWLVSDADIDAFLNPPKAVRRKLTPEPGPDLGGELLVEPAQEVPAAPPPARPGPDVVTQQPQEQGRLKPMAQQRKKQKGRRR